MNNNSLKKLTIRTPKTMGCSLISTIVFQSLKQAFPDLKITVLTKFPELFQNNKYVNNIEVDNNNQTKSSADVDLFDYLRKRNLYDDNVTYPVEHLAIHQLAEAEAQIRIKTKLPKDINPTLSITNNEMWEAEKIVKKKLKGRPFIWLQTQSSLSEKNLPEGFWEKIINNNPQFSFIDLSLKKYNPRISAAITLFCEAGITLDTYLSHASHTVGSKNVIVLLVKKSSDPEMVAYSEQIIIDGRENKSILDCGNVSQKLSNIVTQNKKIPEVMPSEIIADNITSVIIEEGEVDGNINTYELDIINKFVKIYQPKNIFEFGTFDGRTTLNMAINTSDKSKIYTIDIPVSLMDNTKFKLYSKIIRGVKVRDDINYIDKAKVGLRYKNKNGSEKIEQLFGDSATFNYSPFYDKMDLIFIDGSHAKDYIINDTETAMHMAKTGCVILWHDYGSWEDVTNVLNNYFINDKRFSELKRIKGTRLVFLIVAR
ncbi:MAG: class I SAM-dependent methyltransferase [Parcubacteria group bacterium]